jgi:hypothetical protein
MLKSVGPARSGDPHLKHDDARRMHERRGEGIVPPILNGY